MEPYNGEGASPVDMQGFRETPDSVVCVFSRNERKVRMNAVTGKELGKTITPGLTNKKAVQFLPLVVEVRIDPSPPVAARTPERSSRRA